MTNLLHIVFLQRCDFKPMVRFPLGLQHACSLPADCLQRVQGVKSLTIEESFTRCNNNLEATKTFPIKKIPHTGDKASLDRCG